jgi:hypothetical protein
LNVIAQIVSKWLIFMRYFRRGFMDYQNRNDLSSTAGREEIRQKLQSHGPSEMLNDYSLNDSDRQAIRKEAGLNKKDPIFEMADEQNGSAGGGFVVIAVIAYFSINTNVLERLVKFAVLGVLGVIAMYLLYRVLRKPRITDTNYKIRAKSPTRKTIEKKVGADKADFHILRYIGTVNGADKHFEALNNILSRQPARIKELFEKEYPIGADLEGFNQYIEMGPARNEWVWGGNWEKTLGSQKLLYQMYKSSQLLNNTFVALLTAESPVEHYALHRVYGLSLDDLTPEFSDFMRGLNRWHKEQRADAEEYFS